MATATLLHDLVVDAIDRRRLESLPRAAPPGPTRAGSGAAPRSAARRGTRGKLRQEADVHLHRLADWEVDTGDNT